MNKTVLLFAGLALLTPLHPRAQDLYALDTIQKIEIQFSFGNWDYIMDTAKQGSDSYTMAQWVKINGVQFDSVGVKYKGNSSYNPNNQKNPLHIELDHFKAQSYQGYKDIKLSNGFKDPSFTREVLAYYILKNYMHCSQSNYAKVYINGQQKGLYANTEAVTKSFVDKHFFSNTSSFFFMDNFNGDLRYRGPDSTQYYNSYTIKSDYGWGDLVNLCFTLRNNINQVETILDVDRTLWMLAFDNVLVNLDSYVGQPKHNYYMYKDVTGRFSSIVWDVNEAFGNFTNAGTGSPLTISQEQTMSIMLHSNDTMWPLIKYLLSIPKYKRMYIAHAKTIVSENFSDSSYYYNAIYLQSIADTAYQSDPNKFYTYSQFLSNVTTNVTSGPFTAPGITYLMEARENYLNGTTDFQLVPPTVTNIQPSDTFPLINDTIYITAQVSNAVGVVCGLRYSVMDKFTRIQMLDNGLNGDGGAGDGVYGISIPVSSPEIQYYIYADNSNAGIFFPPRAEHEWYTIDADYATVTSGQVVVNELMAVNNTTQANGLGNFGDWIELYNNTNDTVSLDNLYLSDDMAVPVKWQFPDGTNILPNDFLIVWADNDVYASENHSGFKLASTGEAVILSYANGTIIDSISFPSQTADVSYSRCPDGTGQFINSPPSFDSSNNCSVGLAEVTNDNGLVIYPNPSTIGRVRIISNSEPIAKLEVYDFTGRKILFRDGGGKTVMSIDLNGHGKGIYLLRINNRIMEKVLFE
ncbi:MAG: CotH kinase family protein [Bacteroidetes bacterium]|nr:CotH kinase family protein [Bacteroidota bacterium]